MWLWAWVAGPDAAGYLLHIPNCLDYSSSCTSELIMVCVPKDCFLCCGVKWLLPSFTRYQPINKAVSRILAMDYRMNLMAYLSVNQTTTLSWATFHGRNLPHLRPPLWFSCPTVSVSSEQDCLRLYTWDVFIHLSSILGVPPFVCILIFWFQLPLSFALYKKLNESVVCLLPLNVYDRF